MLGDVSQELISGFDSMSESSLGDVRQFCRYARDFKNVKIDGKRITDPLLIALTVPLHADPETGQTFYHEILSAQNQTIGLHGDELKNFVSACAGEVKETPHAEETET